MSALPIRNYDFLLSKLIPILNFIDYKGHSTKYAAQLWRHQLIISLQDAQHKRKFYVTKMMSSDSIVGKFKMAQLMSVWSLV